MKKSKILMFLAAILILGPFVLPLWKITLEAPQYRIPLGMVIYINRFEDQRPHDIQNINLMNHYVGMKAIPETIPEFKIFPIVVGLMAVAGLAIAWFGNPKWYLAWFIVMVIFATIGLYDFYLWEHNYGHDLAPNAIIKITDDAGNLMGFQPPFIGTKHILNFIARSYPGIGAYFLGAGMISGLAAYLLGRKNK